jgi:hypothetical protein
VAQKVETAHSINVVLENILIGNYRATDDVLYCLTNNSIIIGTRWFLLDLDAAATGQTHLLATACETPPQEHTAKRITFAMEGVEGTPNIVLLESVAASIFTFEYSVQDKMLWTILLITRRRTNCRCNTERIR